MLFTIVVPVYKVEEYIEDCIESVLNQTYSDWEMILIDDGSPDNCPFICEKYAKIDSRISVIHKKNGGLSSARNDGIDNASGEYIIFLDSDDIILPNALEKFAKIIMDTPDIIITEMYNTPDVHEVIEKTENYIQPDNNDKETAINFVFSKNDLTWPAQQYIVNRSFINKNNLRFAEGYYHEDVDWTTRLFLVSEKYLYFPQIWYIRRYGRTGSITSVIQPKRTIDMISLTSALIKKDEFSKVAINEKRVIRNQIARAAFSSLIHYSKYEKKDKKRICQLIKDNMIVFECASAKHQKIFTRIMKIIGPDVALTLYCRLFGR